MMLFQLIGGDEAIKASAASAKTIDLALDAI
jgi:hypothetical protein